MTQTRLEVATLTPRDTRFDETNLKSGHERCTRGSGGGAAGREADHSHPSTAKFKNAWSYTSTLPVRLHGGVLG